MRINHNIAALNTYRQLGAGQAGQAKSMEKLSSGLRINRAGDDAAGLAISEKMRGQIRGLDQAAKNSQDGISMIQTAEGALNETHDILQRMRELATQAANDTNTDDDRKEIQNEVNQLTSEINRIGNTTEFNTKKLLNGSISDQSGVAKVADGSFNANGTTVSNLSLNKKSSLEAGNYEVVVADATTKSGNVTGVNNTEGVTGVSVSSNASIANGDYAVKLEKTTGRVYDATDSTLNSSTTGVSSVSVGNTSLTAGNYTLDISRTDATAGFAAGTSGGITAVSVENDIGLNAGDYRVDVTKIVDDSLGNVGNVGDTNPITSLTVATDAADSIIGDLKVVYNDLGAGKYSVQLYSNDQATTISDAVILDDNVQSYEFYNGGTALGVSFTTDTGVNAKIAANTNGGGSAIQNSEQGFTVGTRLSLIDVDGVNGGAAGSSLGHIDLAFDDDGTTDAKISLAGGDVTIAHSGNASLTEGNATFNVTNSLSYDFNNGAATGSVALGGSVSLTNGVTFTMSNDINDYTDGSTATINLDNQDVVQATLIDKNAGDAQVAGTAQIIVDANKSYDFGNGVSFTTHASDMDLTAATEETTFTVSSATQTNATLKVQGGDTVETLSNVSASSELSFKNGEVKMNIAALTNGTAEFEIEGGVEDQSLTMQVGASAGQGFNINVHDMRANALGITSDKSGASVNIQDSQGNTKTAYFTATSSGDVTDGTNNTGIEWALDVSSADKASAAIKVLDNAINSVSSERSKLGAFQNRLEHTINNLGTSSENLTAAESRIRDVDMAKEMMNQTKNSILSQAAQAMLAQANQQPQGVLQLLR